MKKTLMLLLAVVFLSVSCSSDDSSSNIVVVPQTRFFKVKIDGVMTDFPNITASQPAGGGGVRSYFAKMNSTHNFSFGTSAGNTGNTGFLVFAYFVGGVTYQVNATTHNISENTDTKIAGTWSGTAVDSNGDVAFTFTEGSYEINH